MLVRMIYDFFSFMSDDQHAAKEHVFCIQKIVFLKFSCKFLLKAMLELGEAVSSG